MDDNNMTNYLQAAIGQRLRVLDDYLRAQREPVRIEQMTWMEVR